MSVLVTANIAPCTRVSSRASMRASSARVPATRASFISSAPRRRQRRRRTHIASAQDEEEDGFVEFTESSSTGADASEGGKDKKKKSLPGAGVNLYDPAATASRWLTRRFGIVGGLGFVALLASVEGGEILKAVLENAREGEGSGTEFDLGPPELGLVAADLRVGGGSTPKKGDFVGVNVKMTDANDGVVYIDTKRTKRPIAFTYERRPLIPPVCPALEEGVRTMRRGGVRVVTAKSKNAFGDRGAVLTDGTRIPPGTDVVLEITLEEVSNSYL